MSNPDKAAREDLVLSARSSSRLVMRALLEQITKHGKHLANAEESARALLDVDQWDEDTLRELGHFGAVLVVMSNRLGQMMAVCRAGLSGDGDVADELLQQVFGAGGATMVELDGSELGEGGLPE
jgi:hypothetical protein